MPAHAGHGVAGDDRWSWCILGWRAAGGGRLTDLVSVGVLASWLPRDVVDDAVGACGRHERRRGGGLPPHVTAYLVIAMTLSPTVTMRTWRRGWRRGWRGWGCWEEAWEPTSIRISRARKRLGPEPPEELFSQVAVPVAELDTARAFLGPWRLMSADGMELDVPDTAANREAFGKKAGRVGQAAFPKARVVTVTECGSHAPVLAAIGPSAAGKGSGSSGVTRNSSRRHDLKAITPFGRPVCRALR